MKDKDSKRKATRYIQGIPLWKAADISSETLQARREWHDTFKMMKGKKTLQTRILCPTRLSFRFEGEIKSFTDNQKLMSSIALKLALP